MLIIRKVKTFNDKYPFVGPGFWLLCIQYFLVQVAVASAWHVPYSLRQNTISDLGNSACGIYGGRFICSPAHGLMNASFIVLGVSMVIGAMLIYHEFRTSQRSAVGFSFMAIAGVGSVLVGFFPENTIGALHILGAALPFLIGNIGIVILGIYLTLPEAIRYYSIVSGTTSLFALLLFSTGHYFVFGIGGMERIVAYPQTLWLIVFGGYITRSHYMNRYASARLSRKPKVTN